MAVEWSITDEIRLFRWAAEFKPAGVHKHFHMMCIIERMNHPDKYPVTLLQNDSIKLGKTFTTKDIWEKLSGYYNLEEMDKLEYQVQKLQAVPNDGKDDCMLQHRYQLTHKRDFELTWDEYGELILGNARDGVEEDEEDKNSQAAMEGIKTVYEDFSNKGSNSEITTKESGETTANSVRTRRSSRLRKSNKPNRDKSDQSDDENDANDTHINETNDNDKEEKTKMGTGKLDHEQLSAINAGVRSSKNNHANEKTSADSDFNNDDASLNSAGYKTRTSKVTDLRDTPPLDVHSRGSGLENALAKDADIKTTDSKKTDFTDINPKDAGSYGSNLQDSEEKDVGVKDVDVKDAHVQDADSREAYAKASVPKNPGSKNECDEYIEGSPSTGVDHLLASSTIKGYTTAAPSETGLKQTPTNSEETGSSVMVPEKSAATNANPSEIYTSEKLTENKDGASSGSHMTAEKGQNSEVVEVNGRENAQNSRKKEEGKVQSAYDKLNGGGEGREQKDEFDSQINSSSIGSSTGNAPLNNPNEEKTSEGAAPNDEVAEEKTHNEDNEPINEETDQNSKEYVVDQEENSENDVEGITPQNQDQEPHMAEEDSAQTESASQPMARRTRHSAAVTPALNETSPKRKKRNAEQPVPHTAPKRTSTRVSSRLRNRK